VNYILQHSIKVNSSTQELESLTNWIKMTIIQPKQYMEINEGTTWKNLNIVNYEPSKKI
jgi:hypothetical protein